MEKAYTSHFFILSTRKGGVHKLIISTVLVSSVSKTEKRERRIGKRK